MFKMKKCTIKAITLVFILALVVTMPVVAQTKIYLPIIFKSPPMLSNITQIYTRQQLVDRELNYWPDGNMGKIGNQFFAANGENPAKTIGDITSPARYRAHIRIHTTENYNYIAGGPVYHHESGTVVMVYHAEKYINGDYTKFKSYLGIALSIDRVNFYDAGLAISPAFDGVAELGGGPIVINGDYFYMYFRDKLHNGEIVHLAVARARTSDILSGHNIWQKYYNGSFSEPGIGGVSSPLENLNPLVRWVDVKYFDDKYHAVITDANNLYLIKSIDGLDWSDRQKIYSSDSELFYPSIIIESNQRYVFFTSSIMGGFDRFRDAAVMRGVYND